MYNLINYRSLIDLKQILKKVSGDSLLTVAVKDKKYEGGYRPTAMSVSDLIASVGGGGVTAGTYAELKALADAGSLTEGGHYLLTDFRTRARLFDPEAPEVFIEGSIEPLVITAASKTEFTGVAISTIYPEDEIIYEFNNIDIRAELTAKFDAFMADNFINNNNFTAYGADRGFITYRKDPRNRLSAPYDWREYKFKRFENADKPGVYSEFYPNGGAEKQLLTFFNFKDPYAETLNNANYQINDTSIGAYINSNTGYLVANNVVLYADVDAPESIQCFDNALNNANKFSLSGSTFYQNYIDADQFEENKCIPLAPGGTAFLGNLIQGLIVSNNTFGSQVTNNAIISSVVQSNTFGSPTAQPTSSCQFSENMLFKAFVTSNTFLAQSMMSNNISGEIQNCNVDGPRFRYNEISGVIYNLTLTGFVTAGFERNTIEAQATLNSVTIDCPSTSGNFQYNRIQCRNLGPIDFGSSTTQHVRKYTYNKTLTTQSNGTNVLTYLDAAGALTTVAVTA